MTPFQSSCPCRVAGDAICGWVQGGLALQGQSASGQSTNPARSITVQVAHPFSENCLRIWDVAQAKAGDPVDVQNSEDIKSIDDVLFKKGSL